MNTRVWFIVPAALVLMVVITVWMVKSQTAPLQMYAGKDSVIVSLGATTGQGEAGAEELLDRLSHVGISAKPVSVTNQHVELELLRVGEPREAITALLDPEPIHFYVIDDSVAPVDAGPEPVPPAPGMVFPWIKGTSRADVLEKIRANPPPPDRFPVIECIHGDGKTIGVLCAAWLAKPPLPLGRNNVTSAKIGADKRTEEPLVTLTFDADGAKALEQATRENAGKMLAIVAFGELQARPKIEAPFSGNEWTLSTRTGDTDRRTAIERAERLEAAARAKPLPPMVLESIRPAPKPGEPATTGGVGMNGAAGTSGAAGMSGAAGTTGATPPPPGAAAPTGSSAASGNSAIGGHTP